MFRDAFRNGKDISSKKVIFPKVSRDFLSISRFLSGKTPITTKTLEPGQPVLSYPAAFSAWLVGGIIMGFSPVFVREAGVDAFASAFWRVFFALPVLALWAIHSSRRQHAKSFRFTLPAIFAGMAFAGDLTFWHLSILNTTMANATFLTGLAPVWVIMLSNLMLKEKPPKAAFVGIIICLAGMGLLINSSLRIDPSRILGDFYGIITSFFLALYIIAIRTGTRKSSNANLFLASTLVTTLTLLIVCLAISSNFLPETPGEWGALVSLGVITHAGGQGLLTLAIAALTAAFSSLVIFVEAIAAALFGWWLFDETMDGLQIAGCLLILAGIWISRPEKIDKISNS